ncbi:DUF5067 domain-containing protein [Bifidobacterium myosotis]|uniref:DUF5067 domain-containing protein n=2 Tax=Bifidobacterium myosotis TaxID=1630166 RepID=A0A5M9ZHM8_9BIFI|nr:DUF5067 domain-containing protein [Bifidobacterium myosotis]
MTGAGIAGLVVGIIALIIAVIPIIGLISWVLAPIALILAIVGMVGSFRGKRRGRAISVVAAVLAVASVVLSIGMTAAAGKALDSADARSELSSLTGGTGAEAPKTDVPKTDAPKTDAGAASGKGEQDTEGDVEGAHVRIVSAVKSANDYNGRPTVLVTFEWTNTSDKNQSFAIATHPQVFQNGAALENAIYLTPPAGYDAMAYTTELQPGTKGTLAMGFVLKDDSPVTVDVTSFLSLDDSTKIVHTYDLK